MNDDVINQLNTLKERADIAERAGHLLVDCIDDFVQKHESDSIDTQTINHLKEIVKIVKKTKE
jgi:hypothetical protein